MHRLAPEAGIVSVYHGATVREMLGKEVSQPHSLKVPLPFPGTVCVPVKARDSDDAEVV